MSRLISIRFQTSDVLLSEVRIKDQTKKRICTWCRFELLAKFCNFFATNASRIIIASFNLRTQIQWKSKIFSSAAGRKWTKGEMKIEEVLVLVAPLLDDGSLNGHRIYSDRRIYSPPDWNLGGRGRFSVTKDGFETCKILKKMSAGLICFIARETASRYWGNQGQLYPTKVKYTPTFFFDI